MEGIYFTCWHLLALCAAKLFLTELSLNVLRCLELVVLLGLMRGSVTSGSHDEMSETDLAVDLLLALEVGLGSTLATEDNVLYAVSMQILMSNRDGIRTISSRVRRLVSGTMNQMKAAPR
jgi:hypothetical protein